MTQCEACGEDFPLLDTGTRCGRCSRRKPGMSAPELREINEKPQCCGCGVTASALKHPLCPKCIEHYRSAEDVPRALFKIAGIADLIAAPEEVQSGDEEIQEVARGIAHAAEQHRAGASTHRLGKPKVATQGISAGLKQLQKKKTSIVAERKVKKTENEIAKTGVRISGQVWLKVESGKMNALVECKADGVFPLDTSTQTALDKVFLELRDVFKKHYQTAAQLNWSHVTLYSHENQGSYASLDKFDKAQPISKLLDKFIANGWGSKKNLEDRKLAIRFLVVSSDVFEDDDEWNGVTSARSSSLSSKARASKPVVLPTSKRKRGGGASAPMSKQPFSAGPLSSRSLELSQIRNRPPVPIPDWSNSGSKDKVKLSARQIISTAHAHQYQQEARPSAIRRSAYRPPGYQPAFTRNPTVLERHSIYKHTASCSSTGGSVSFHRSSDESTIELPPLSDLEDKRSVGFVGEGLTKRGIYARHLGKEYVITQLKDPNAKQHDNKTILIREMELLVQGHWFKQEFAKEAELCGVTLPPFDFNVEGSFIGELIPTATSGSRPLPLLHFIATPLLPCGELDAPICKFTGNDQVGPSKDHMTQLIHAFAHFTYLCSGGSLVFCDLQGARDKDGTLRLIDPQIHTHTDRENRHAYWDGGPDMIAEFVRQHETSCQSNFFCGKLGQRGAHVYMLSSAAGGSATTSPASKRAKTDADGDLGGNKKPIGFMLNS